MTRVLRLVALTVAILLPQTSSAEGTVYRWTDESGHVHYSQTRPSDGRYDVIQGRKILTPNPSSNGDGAETAGSGGSAEAATAQRERDRRFLEQAQAEREAKEKEKEKLRTAKLEAEKKCKEARDRAQFLEERTARRLVTKADDGNYARMEEDEFLKRLNAAKADIAANCR